MVGNTNDLPTYIYVWGGKSSDLPTRCSRKILKESKGGGASLPVAVLLLYWWSWLCEAIEVYFGCQVNRRVAPTLFEDDSWHLRWLDDGWLPRRPLWFSEGWRLRGPTFGLEIFVSDLDFIGQKCVGPVLCFVAKLTVLANQKLADLGWVSCLNTLCTVRYGFSLSTKLFDFLTNYFFFCPQI